MIPELVSLTARTPFRYVLYMAIAGSFFSSKFAKSNQIKSPIASPAANHCNLYARGWKMKIPSLIIILIILWGHWGAKRKKQNQRNMNADWSVFFTVFSETKIKMSNFWILDLSKNCVKVAVLYFTWQQVDVQCVLFWGKFRNSCFPVNWSTYSVISKKSMWSYLLIPSFHASFSMYTHSDRHINAIASSVDSLNTSFLSTFHVFTSVGAFNPSTELLSVLHHAVQVRLYIYPLRFSRYLYL